MRVILADHDLGALRPLRSILENSQAFLVVGQATGSQEALELVHLRSPQVLLMSATIEPWGGIETIRQILSEVPVPIVVYVPGGFDSGSEEGNPVAGALKAGAVAAVDYPGSLWEVGAPQGKEKLLRTLRSMAQVRVITQKRHKRPEREKTSPRSATPAPTLGHRDVDVVAIGASTGGPNALRTVFSKLPAEYPLPILVVQHIAPGFLESMVAWLDRECALTVGIAREGEKVGGGKVYFAPDHCHMGVTSRGRILLDASGPIEGLRPSVAFLFGSIGAAYGARCVGILMSGMGSDGAWALQELKVSGAITVAQDQATSVVFGMPKKAIEIDGATHVLSPEAIGNLLLQFADPS